MVIVLQIFLALIEYYCMFLRNNFLMIQYFEEDVPFLTISKDNIIWMSITPNETWTILPAIERSFGKVITFGVGLGYYPLMCALKENVESVTIVEFEL